MKRFLKGAEGAVRNVRDDLKEAAKDVKAAVDSGVLKKATKDQREASHAIDEAVKAKMKESEAAKSTSQAAWDALLNDQYFPAKYNKDAVKAKVAAVADLHAAVAGTAKNINDKLHEITGRPDDGSTSSTAAEEDCKRLLGEQQQFKSTFDEQLAKFSTELDKLTALRKALEAETADARIKAELLNQAEVADMLAGLTVSSTVPGPALTPALQTQQSTAEGLPTAPTPSTPTSTPNGNKLIGV